MGVTLEQQTETLNAQNQIESTVEKVDPSVATTLGRTVFEELAVGADDSIEQSEDLGDLKISNSLTRRPGGATVPDEF